MLTQVGGSVTVLDMLIIALYFAAVLYIGIRVARMTETGEDLFLAGRSLTWGVIGFSLFASNISSTTLIGLAGAAYSTGLSVSNYEWMAGVVLVFMSAFIIPLYLRSRITTVPEFLERRFDVRSRKYFSAITIFLSIAVDTAGGIYAGALVLQVFYPELVLWQTCMVLAAVAGIYTAFGGLKAVVYTDVIQAIVLLLGSTLLVLLIMAEFDFSWAAATEAVPPDHLSVIRPLDDEALPWLGTLIGVPVLGFWYWATNQYITQRVLGARSVTDAQWGAVMGGALKLIPLFTMVIPGALALSLFPDLDNPDMVFPTLVGEILPVGITGLVLAGLIAAIMSSIDSTLNSASTLVVHDFVEPAKPDLTPTEVGAWGRYTTLILMVIAALWAPAIGSFGGLFAYLQQAFSILVPPVAAIFLLGVFWARGTAAGAFYTLLVGHVLGLIVFILTQMGVITLHFTINAGIMTGVSALVFVLVSLRTPQRTEEVSDTIWRPALAKPERPYPWYQDYRVLGGIVLALTALTVITFW